ncbi:SDR family NAD(P)-dependent oxidoreductase [Streptomyces sp. DT20]|uniref:SDR family NAD(P)-dependent oxidoreductase n=1 Tax=unclassified Streptomyces TaxID=2593676 RepID=UPI00288AAA24|nr:MULTISPECIES: glucose 1-dehydrogenase [unclassified Streptomyces]WNI34577.1 glucose 1-dehydrogenase [Streptomyces sp. ITFR-6]WRZ16863.1 glucose 1-dehydrogenase [Streptomyces sp. NBC_00341]
MNSAAAPALEGKVVIVHGASSGIGAAAGRVFARHGAVVVLTARREDRLRELVGRLRATGAEASHHVVDVRDGEAVRRAVDSTVQRYGRLDGAFNNAGVGLPRTPMHLIEDDVYERVLSTNVTGVWNCMRHEIAAMLKGGGGAIVNTSSVGGLVASSTGAPYIASKHAVLGLTKAAAVEYAPHGIRVNAIAPGLTRSEMMDDWFASSPEVEERASRSAPQARAADPEEVAETAAWLCSDLASFVTGATLPVDGGRTAW